MSQIFKNIYPLEKLDFFLKIHCTYNNNYYLFTCDNYKQYVFNNKINDFINSLYPYIFKAKQKYLTRKITFKTFMTIIRQICKSQHIPIISKIKYNKSSYQTDYYIFIN
tara:strand:+ start:2353 stop:2679 length:327 start_codon:yes stop_codon:yes gene_type:complete